MNLNGSPNPGIQSNGEWIPRSINWNSGFNKRYIPSGKTIDGSKSRDPLNTSNVDVLRPGLLLGKISASGKYAPSIIGVTGEAIDGAETAVTVGATVVTELVRRQGASGTFKLTGPPTASGTVRTATVTYSAASGTTITITAIGVADVWTLTAPAGQDAGTYQLEVTTGKGTSAEVVATTASLAANANTATVDAALEALANVGTGGVAAVYSDPTLTLTFASSLGPVHVRVINDTTNDGGAWEGGWAAVHTTTGVSGEFVTGSLIQPTDGSETIKTILDEELKVTNEDGTSQDTQAVALTLSASVKTSKIIDYPADSSLKTWVKAALTASGPYEFDDNF